MPESLPEQAAALDEMRRLLIEALERARLTKSDLARQTGLGRTTVHAAFQPNGPVPSAHTIHAMARRLRLPVDELLRLRRTAATPTGTAPGETKRSRPGAEGGPGRPIGDCDPHDLGVHVTDRIPDLRAVGERDDRALPTYVVRPHDRALTTAVQDAREGRSRLVVLVGSSSTGKTRACWEAVRSLTQDGWRLWHPFQPTPTKAVRSGLAQVRPRTVVWLDDAQHYMDNPRTSENVAAQLRALLNAPESRPVLILATLWPEFVDRYTALPTTALGDDDPYHGTRALLAGCMVTIPDAFTAEELGRAAVLARHDPVLADALTRTTGTGRVAQDLAGAPELLRRYAQAAPASRAVLEAAMDARRLGAGLHLAAELLSAAAVGYLDDDEFDRLSDRWADEAYADLARTVHGNHAPLRKARARATFAPNDTTTATAVPTSVTVFRLADYLEQHGRDTRHDVCPPDSFWHAVAVHTTVPGELNELARAAQRLGRHPWARHLRRRAFLAGDPTALYVLALVQLRAGDDTEARTLFREAADAGCTEALYDLAQLHESGGDHIEAEATAREAARAGGTETMYDLAARRERTGDAAGAQRLYQEAADAGDLHALIDVARLREGNGDRDGARSLYEQAAKAGDFHALVNLARMKEESGDREGAEVLALRAASDGYTDALYELARLRELDGDPEGAAVLHQKAVQAGNIPGADLIAQRRTGNTHRPESGGERDSST